MLPNVLAKLVPPISVRVWLYLSQRYVLRHFFEKCGPSAAPAPTPAERSTRLLHHRSNRCNCDLRPVVS